MAKSKSGGTRSYIRGRVGADVYSIGKDAKGAKQQVVRSLAETVSNPQTTAQMRGRMIMSTVMQAVSAMRPIIDHSFDNRPTGQPNISEFISRNYALIKADVAAHPTYENEFGVNKYNEKGIKCGHYVLSQGEEVLPSGIEVSTGQYPVVFALPSNAVTFAGLKSVLNLGAEDYITLVGISATKGFCYCRLHWKEPADLTTAVTAANILTAFTLEGNFTPVPAAVTGETNKFFATGAEQLANAGVIITRKTSAGFKHSACQLNGADDYSFTADTALPSYPRGTEMFLNGGDL